MAGTVGDAWQLGSGFKMTRPRGMDDVGQSFTQFERWANQIPFTQLLNTPLPAQQSVTANAVFADVLDFKADITPRRLGQLIVVFIQTRASRAVGVAQLQGQVTLQVGAAAPVLQPGMFFMSAALDSKVHLVPYVSSSLRKHTFQVQMCNAGGATTWLIRSPESSVTILSI